MYTQLEQREMSQPPVNVASLAKMKEAGEKIACLTAYDASFAQLVDKAQTDLVLVGDSLGMVIQGHDTTVPVTVDDMIYHSRTVARGLRRSFLMTDMPFMSYTDPAQALDNAVRMMQEGGAMMVKLEGGEGQIEIVQYLARHDIPVCAHIGLKPQSVHKIGGFRVQGRDPAAAKKMLDSAKRLQDVGADIVLLECVPNEVGASVTDALDVPVIGIGAGPDVDGQILVLYDAIGVTQGKLPRFVRDFSVGAESPLNAIANYVSAVKTGEYPAPEHCFS
ncbi:MAG: 3-methyl-2-oxobutanoate hydroxymethyltransferase [Pseudomonadota bacterium]